MKKENYKKIAITVLSVVFALTGLSLYFLQEIKIEYNFEDFFDKGDEDFVFYTRFREEFGDDNDYFLISVEEENGVFNQAFLNDIHLLTDKLSGVDGVLDVISPTNLKNKIASPMGISQIPFIHLQNPERFKTDSSLIYSYDDLVQTFFAPNGKSVALVVHTVHLKEATESKEMMGQVYEVLDSFEFDDIHMAGKVIAEVTYVEKMGIEFVVFFLLSAVLLVVFLTIAFRSIWGVLLPLTVVLISVLCSLGVMSITGKSIDVMSILLPSIIFVVGMSDVIHIVAKYLDEIRKGVEKYEAVRITFKEVGVATLLTSITTAIGFLTLMTVEITPMKEFGLYMSIGVMLAFVLSFMVLPSSLVLLKKPKIADKKVEDLFWYLRLHQLLRWVLRWRRMILIGTIAVLFFSGVGISFVKVDAKLIDEVKDDSPLKKDFMFFEEHYGGARPFELAIEVLDSNLTVFDYEIIQELNRIESYLKFDFQTSNLRSPVSLVKTLNRALNGGVPEYYKVPQSAREYKKIYRLIKKMKKSEELSKLVSSDWKFSRFSGSINDVGLIEMEKRKEAFALFIDHEFAEVDSFKCTVTGSSLLIDKSNKSLSHNMIEGLLVAFFVISIIMGVLYRSLRVIVVALIPNIIPLLLIGAIMGYFGIDLKMSTAIIFTISFGIAVDDTIHFMSKLKLELSKGKSKLYAMKRTFLSTGKAIIVTSCILVGGFLMLIGSEFKGTFYTGLLVSLTLLFAVLADLILIPILIIYFYKDSKAKN